MFKPTSLFLSFLLFVCNVSAFGVYPSNNNNKRLTTRLAADSGDMGSVERIEFKIYPDGRVEETVRGVKGNDCHKVTEKINEALGKVVDSTPTEEMYENNLVIDQTLTNKVGDNDSGASWEGSSSW